MLTPAEAQEVLRVSRGADGDGWLERRDNRGHRLPEWIKQQPGLFDEE